MKKIFAIIIAFAMLLSAIPAVSAAENIVATFESVVYSGEKYATISWDAVGGTDVYKLYITSESGEFDLSETTTQTSYNWSPYTITPDEAVFIKIYAYDAQGVLIGKSIELEVYVNVILYHYGGIYGDVDFDENVSILDATLIMQKCAEMIEFGKSSTFVADVDSDGDITVLDATVIQYHCADIELSDENIIVGESFFFGEAEFHVVNMRTGDFEE